jgi:hypothetical protein
VPLPRRRRVAIGLLAALVVDAGLVAIAMPAGAARVGGQDESAEVTNEKVANLEIIEPGASVRRSGKENFKPAKDGQKLRVGDTVQTDATGFVEIVYADDSFTRLDVNTTFTIESLTDDEGNRKIKGSVESGQTWNRVEALTENESFEQEGAGATAAVTGTAFAYACDAVTNTCVLTTVVDGVTYSTQDGELKAVDPLQECEATEIDETDSDLCDVPTELTEAALIANAWIMQNLFLDGLLGYEVPLFGVIVVEDGVVTSFTPTPPPGDETPAAPVILDPALDVTENDSPFGGTGPQTEIITDEENSVVFTINTGGATYIVFTDLFEDDPNAVGPGALNGGPSFGTLLYQDGESWLAVQTLLQYLSTTNFKFQPGEVVPPFFGEGLGAQGEEVLPPYSETGDFTFYVETAGGVRSAPETVTVTVHDVPYECEFEGGSTASATNDDAPAAPEVTEQTPADPAE